MSMAKIYKDNGQQLVSWWNLQTYGGADPQAWIDGMNLSPIVHSAAVERAVAARSASAVQVLM